MRRRFLLTLIFSFVCLLTLAIPAFAQTINVPADYSTIQSAINAASSGDTVQVAIGTCDGGISVKSGVTLQGAGAETTIIEGHEVDRVIAINGGAATTKFDGFTIQNGSSNYGGGIKCTGSNVIVSNNIIINNFVDEQGGGIFCAANSSIEIRDNVIAENGAWEGAGIFCDKNSSSVVEGNAILYNFAVYGAGLLSVQTNPTICC